MSTILITSSCNIDDVIDIKYTSSSVSFLTCIIHLYLLYYCSRFSLMVYTFDLQTLIFM